MDACFPTTLSVIVPSGCKLLARARSERARQLASGVYGRAYERLCVPVAVFSCCTELTFKCQWTASAPARLTWKEPSVNARCCWSDAFTSPSVSDQVTTAYHARDVSYQTHRRLRVVRVGSTLWM